MSVTSNRGPIGAPPVIASAGAARSPRAVLARSISILVGGQLVTWTATLAWTLIVPRQLGAAQVGVYTLGQASAGLLLVVVGMGMRPLLVREIAADRSRGPHLIGTAIILRALLAIPAMVVVVLVARFGPFSRDEAFALVLGGSMCVFFVVSEPIISALQAIEKMRYLAYATTLSSIVISVGSIGLVTLGVRADGLLLASVIVTGVVALLSLIWVREHFQIDWQVRLHDLRTLLVDSLPYWSGAVFFTLYLWIDSVMLAVMTPSTVLGWYGLPTRLFGALMVVPVIFTTAWLPQLTHAFQQGTPALYRAARGPIELVLILSLPVCVGTVLISGPLVQVLYGPGFAGSIPVLAILALCVPPMYLNIMANQVMIARKRQMTWTKVMVIASVVNPVLNLVLIPYFQRSHGNGAIGAAVAMVITEVILAGIGVGLVRGAFSPSSIVRLLKGGAATAGMAAAVIPALHLGLFVGIVAGAVSFPVLALLLHVLSEEQRDQLRTLAARIRRGGRAESRA